MTTTNDIINQVIAEKSASSTVANFLRASACAESGGNASAKCSTSSAYGIYQVLDGTWANLAKKHPELTNRRDPHQQVLAGYYYAQENAASLQANGHPVTEGNLYLSHFLGAGGANKVLSADPGTPLSSLVSPGVMSANRGIQLAYTGTDGKEHKKSFANFTAGDLRAWASKKMGGRINYSLLDRDVQGEVAPWQGDDENPANGFKALGNMSFGEIIGALLIGLLGNLFGGQSQQIAAADQTTVPTPPPATPAPAKPAAVKPAPARQHA